MTDHIETIIEAHTQTRRINAAERQTMRQINDGQINRLRDIAAALKRKWDPGDIVRARGDIETIVAEIDAAGAECMVGPMPQTMATPQKPAKTGRPKKGA
jgi:hypothetical protein